MNTFITHQQKIALGPKI